MPGPGEEPTFGDETKIFQIDLSPEQSYHFSPSEFISFNDKSKGILKIPIPIQGLKEASIKLKFTYKDLLKFIDYQEEYNLITEVEDKKLKWKIVSEAYYDIYKKGKW